MPARRADEQHRPQEGDAAPRPPGAGREDERSAGSGRGSPGRMTAAAAAQAGLRQLKELTGRAPEGVTSVEPGEGGWLVGVEVLEDRRVPSSSDVLATYEVEVDSDGSLLAYRRLRRYPRGRGGSDGEGP